MGLALGLVACGWSGYGGSNGRVSGRQVAVPERLLHGWHDDGGPGTVSIRISLDDQIAEFKRGGRDIGWCYVATGKEGHATLPGSYHIMEKIVDKHSNRFGWIEDGFGTVVDDDATPADPVPKGMVYVPAPMPYWMRLTSGGVGMHGGVIPNPGQPASHGCIRMPKDFAPVAFAAVPVGTPVTITHGASRHSPEPDGLPPAPMPPESRVLASQPVRPDRIARVVPMSQPLRHGRPGT